MSVIALALKHMLAAGMPHDSIVAAVAEMEANLPAAQAEDPRERKLAKARERQARYEDRQRQKASEQRQETSGNVNSASEASGLTLPLSLPPSPQTPQPPTHTREGDYAPTREADLFVEPAPAPSPKARATRLPSDWRPGADEVTYAAQQGLTPEEIDRAAEDFRDYWTARPGAGGTKLSWPATWRGRIREVADRAKRDRGRMAPRPGFTGGGGSGVEDFASIVARRRGFNDA